MVNQLGIAAAGLVALGVTLVPQIASAQAIDHGGPGDIRMHGGQGHFGQGFRNDQGRFGGMERRGPDNLRYGDAHRQFGQGQGFRFNENRAGFGERDGFRFHPRPGQFGYGGFGGERRFDHHRGFGAREFRPGVRFGVVRHYPVYGAYGYRHVGWRPPYAPAYPINTGYAFPRAGCSSHRTVSLTPVGWHKIVTVRTCYVR